MFKILFVAGVVFGWISRVVYAKAETREPGTYILTVTIMLLIFAIIIGVLMVAP